MLLGDGYYQAQVGFNQFELILQNHIFKKYNAVIKRNKLFFRHGQHIHHLGVAALHIFNVGKRPFQFGQGKFGGLFKFFFRNFAGFKPVDQFFYFRIRAEVIVKALHIVAGFGQPVGQVFDFVG